jgi:clathrin heavy chain
MQLYSVEQAKSQPLEAHAAAFSTVKFSGRDLPSNVISFAQKTLKDGQVLSKLHVIELGTAPGAYARARVRGGGGGWGGVGERSGRAARRDGDAVA